MVDIKAIYDAIDTSSLMDVRTAIEKENSAQIHHRVQGDVEAATRATRRR